MQILITGGTGLIGRHLIPRLRPKRSLWRKMVMGGLALFGASVVGQGVQWTMNAWQTQDWFA
ncbi:hypothetical protein MJN76_34790, partial [Salmonella enterica subsp. enterica serovar Anatum]|nr:hypothetical protein [Salmonella enterica subsp. enterica serovar Anatum]